MKRFIALTALCAVLLAALVMPAGAAFRQTACPDTASVLTLLFQLLGSPGSGDCDITLPTRPTTPEAPQVQGPACGEADCESGSTCPDSGCETECDTPAGSDCGADLGTCPTPPAQPEEEAPAVTSPTDPENSVRAYEQEVVRLVNEIRAQYGLDALTESSALSDVAREKSRDMYRNNYFDHESPTYGSPFDMMRAFGISYRTAAENIAVGYRTPAATVQGWMDSPTHRAAMLSSGYTHTGVGYVAGGNYWTQMFIS